MREVKFRAWNKETKKMMNWDHIQSFKNFQKLLTLQFVFIMQYTGLKDKNGKDIYEGDIVVYHHYEDSFGNTRENEYRKGEVIWDDESAMHGGWRVKERRVFPNGYINENSIERFPNVSTKNNMASIEVIGNIYQNPELLKD